jgi:hypothetical protein
VSALGQNPNASRTLACQLSPAADKPPPELYSAMCQDTRGHISRALTHDPKEGARSPRNGMI